jgi:phosphoglycerate dehydrogenase-like enzyme
MTQQAIDTLASELATLPVTPVVLDGEGEIEGIEVAWASNDMYQHGHGRRFFGAATHSPTLKWLQVANAGTDDPVFGRLMANGVTLTTSHVTGPPIAEYTLRAVLDWFQRADEWRATVQERQWKGHQFREVLGTTWLVIGLGAIGSAVAVRAQAFGTHVIGVRRTPRGDEPVHELVAPDDVLSVLPRADVVVLALPYGNDTAGMVDATFLAAMKAGSVLVNVARGPLVDEAALIAALDTGIPDAALLDVAATEPPEDDSPLWAHPKVVLTPHSSALGFNRHERAAAFFLENLRRYLAGETLHNVVTAPA